MPDNRTLGPWVRRFLEEHLVSERNLARNTQLSYRDTFALLLPFASASARKPVDRLAVRDLGPGIVREFLQHLEQERGCSPQTRNQRLAAVRSFVRYVAGRCPEHVEWCGQIRAIPLKKAAPAPVGYLEKPEMVRADPCHSAEESSACPGGLSGEARDRRPARGFRPGHAARTPRVRCRAIPLQRRGPSIRSGRIASRGPASGSVRAQRGPGARHATGKGGQDTPLPAMVAHGARARAAGRGTRCRGARFPEPSWAPPDAFRDSPAR